MSSKQQIEKDREKIAELYKIIREKTHNYELAIEALLLASKYLNKTDNQRKELALREEIIRCGDCKHFNDGDCEELPKIVSETDFCSFAERTEQYMAIEALEQEETLQNLTKPNKSDLISRKAAIDVVNRAVTKEVARWSIQELPSAQPFTAEQIQTMQELESAQVEKAYELGKADRPTDEEDQLKFYYVESLDDYWVGRRLDNFYYATWHGRFGFIWSHSKYLPWGEHIVDENTLWKEHTYPSEPKEIPFTEWIVGFVKKYFADRPTGHWIETAQEYYEMINGKGGGVDENTPYFIDDIACSECLAKFSVIDNETERFDFCPNCGCAMKGGEEE